MAKPRGPSPAQPGLAGQPGAPKIGQPLAEIGLILGFDLKCRLQWDCAALLPDGTFVGSFAGRRDDRGTPLPGAACDGFGRPHRWRAGLALPDALHLPLQRPGAVAVVLERPVAEDRDPSGRTYDQLSQTLRMLAGWAAQSLGATTGSGRLMLPTCADVRRWAEENQQPCPLCGYLGTDADGGLCPRCFGAGTRLPRFPWKGSDSKQDAWIKRWVECCPAGATRTASPADRARPGEAQRSPAQNLGYDTARGQGLGNADVRDALLCARFGLARLGGKAC